MNIIELENGKYELKSPSGEISYGIFDTYMDAKNKYIQIIFIPTEHYFTN